MILPQLDQHHALQAPPMTGLPRQDGGCGWPAHALPATLSGLSVVATIIASSLRYTLPLLVAFFCFSPSIAVRVPAAPIQLAVLPDSAMVDHAQVARHNFLLLTQLQRKLGCAGITVSMLRHGIMTNQSHKQTRGRSLRAEFSLASYTIRMSYS